MSVALRIASPRSAGVLWLERVRIGDNVRLSASAVYAALALSHTYGDYNCHAPVFGIVIARSSKTAFVGDYYYDY